MTRADPPHLNRPTPRDVPEPFWLRTIGTLSLHADPADRHPLMEAGKPLALLTYVALSPDGAIPRDHVAELLWPGCEQAEARHSLRQCLYRLRQITGGAPLVSIRGADLVLERPVGVDCLEGERLAADGGLSRACELLDGNFLEGFAIAESREFENWAEAQRMRFRDGWTRAARRLAEDHMRRGDGARALALAERLAALRPFDDHATRLVMAALAEAGKHATALARFHAHAELLQREMGEEPGAELTRYARELEEYLKARPEPPGGLLPFVGRAGQWAALEGAWEAARDVRGSTLLIEGAAGLGKTRLLGELIARVRAGGGVVLLGKCFEIERAVPYAGVAEALAPLVDRQELEGLGRAWLAEAARLLPELREHYEDLPAGGHAAGSEAAKRRLHEALVRCVEAVAARGPVVVAVDDVHWGDAASLEVLHRLSKRLAKTSVLIVASYRPAELSPVARQFARSLCADRLADVALLEPLSEEDIRHLLHRLAEFESGAVAETVARQLHRHTGGNPLFLNELLDTLARQDILVARDGRWRFAAGAEPAGLPRTLGKLLADRVDALAPWMRACVETLAVCGEESLVELIAAALELSEPRAELALSVLEEERLVRRVGAGVFDLAHDELRRLVYQGIPDDRRRLLHAAVGLALEGQGEVKRPGGAARLAYHFDQAADQERAHRYALMAAGEAGALAVADAERAHLAIAEAHAPRALPPRAASLMRRGRRRLAAVVGAAVLLAGGVVAGGLVAPSLITRPGWQQGALYLEESGVLGPTHVVKWRRFGRPPRVEELPKDPDAPRYFVRSVTERGETHSKVFRTQSGDTVQLTFGPTDDGFRTWSPDRRWLVVQRGWRSSATRFQSNFFLLDSLGRTGLALTNTIYQDQALAWSSTGPRIVFSRDSAGTSTIWLADADGRHLENLTQRFRLPDLQGLVLAFAPDGRRLGVLHRDQGTSAVTLRVLDLEDGTTQLNGLGRAESIARLVWSPDGRWVVYSVLRDGQWSLIVVAADGSQAPTTLARLDPALWIREWSNGSRRHITRVELSPRLTPVETGGRSASRCSSDAGGRPIDVDCVALVHRGLDGGARG